MYTKNRMEKNTNPFKTPPNLTQSMFFAFKYYSADCSATTKS